MYFGLLTPLINTERMFTYLVMFIPTLRESVMAANKSCESSSVPATTATVVQSNDSSIKRRPFAENQWSLIIIIILQSGIRKEQLYTQTYNGRFDNS